jgi:dTDP-4-dehydrorhamnose 3,5-epimerase
MQNCLPAISATLTPSTRLPEGVRIVPLTTHEDDRGSLTEVFRQSWAPNIKPCQWNVVSSGASVLRGVHVHLTHSDYLILLSGVCVYGLYDCRRGSPTEFQSAMIEASGSSRFALIIPPGVAHGFYFQTDSLHLYAVTHYWDPSDELGCRYDDPDLGIDWPRGNVIISPRDQVLPTLQELIRLVPPWEPELQQR